MSSKFETQTSTDVVYLIYYQLKSRDSTSLRPTAILLGSNWSQTTVELRQKHRSVRNKALIYLELLDQTNPQMETDFDRLNYSPDSMKITANSSNSWIWIYGQRGDGIRFSYPTFAIIAGDIVLSDNQSLHKLSGKSAIEVTSGGLKITIADKIRVKGNNNYRLSRSESFGQKVDRRSDSSEDGVSSSSETSPQMSESGSDEDMSEKGVSIKELEKLLKNIEKLESARPIPPRPTTIPPFPTPPPTPLPKPFFTPPPSPRRTPPPSPRRTPPSTPRPTSPPTFPPTPLPTPPPTPLPRGEDWKYNLKGLDNIGLICYMNSSIQALYAIQEFRDYIIGHHCSKPLHKSLGDLFDRMNEPTKEITSVNPTEFWKTFTNYKPEFKDMGQEQDAHEFLRFIIDGLQRELNNAQDSPLATLFAGQLRSTLKCTHCSYESHRPNPFWDICLPIPPTERNIDIKYCLKKYSAPERLDTEIQCPQCNRKRQFNKFDIFETLPNVLVIELLKFKANGQKILRLIEINETIVIQNTKYSLFACISHYGDTVSDGHYDCHCTYRDNQWFVLDDALVETTFYKDFSSAYILFYRREGSSSPQQTPEDRPKRQPTPQPRPQSSSSMSSSNSDLESDSKIDSRGGGGGGLDFNYSALTPPEEKQRLRIPRTQDLYEVKYSKTLQFMIYYIEHSKNVSPIGAIVGFISGQTLCTEVLELIVKSHRSAIRIELYNEDDNDMKQDMNDVRSGQLSTLRPMNGAKLYLYGENCDGIVLNEASKVSIKAKPYKLLPNVIKDITENLESEVLSARTGDGFHFIITDQKLICFQPKM